MPGSTEAGRCQTDLQRLPNSFLKPAAM